METKSEISCSGLFNYFLWISSLPKAIFGRENIDNVGDFLLNTATEQTRYLSSYRKYIEYTNISAIQAYYSHTQSSNQLQYFSPSMLH